MDFSQKSRRGLHYDTTYKKPDLNIYPGDRGFSWAPPHYNRFGGIIMVSVSYTDPLRGVRLTEPFLEDKEGAENFALIMALCGSMEVIVNE